MALLARIFVILFACFAACFAAGAVVTVAALMPAWSDLLVDAFAEGTFGDVVAFGALFLSFFALMPALIVIILTEAFAIRSSLFYAFVGAGVGCLLYLNASGWNTLAFNVNGFARRELEIMAAAGIVAGFVYWAIAGRNAGGWRRAEAG